MKTNTTIFSVLFLLTLVFSFMQKDIQVFASEVPSITSNYEMVPGESTNARISLENMDTVPHTYTLNFGQLPEGFNGYFSLDGKVINSITISASQKNLINFFIDVPLNTSATNMSIPLEIIRDDGVKESLSVSFTLNPNYALSISSSIQSIKAINGDSIMLEIGVTNTGNKDLTDLSLQVDPPYKWIVDNVDPTNLTLKPGENSLYKLKVTIPTSGQAGQYPINISCTNSDVTSNSISIPVNVSTSVNYFWWITGIIGVLLIFTILYFKKHGRR
ncbi:MAG: NEW3 domain-containing protein [Lachnospiraceae bacterium]|nr:NEW3 domain-containing protein [Lachnospiraceae bacterium]